jgi:hypothetical protein
MHMQQTYNKLQRSALSRYTRLAGLTVGLAFAISLVFGYAPIGNLWIGSSAVYAQTPTPTPTPSLPPQTVTSNCPKGQCIIDKYIQPGINLAAGLVGLAVTVSIISAGIKYTMSADSPQKVSEAKQRLVTSVFVLIGFFTFYALMNYLIPGGLV